MSTSTILGGIFRTLLAFAVIVPMATPLASQESSICSLVTVEDAATIFGSSAKESKDGRGCIWEDATGKQELIVRAINIPSVFDAARSETARDGQTRDEPGLGAPAFSTIPTDGHGNRIEVYTRKGSTVFILGLDATGAGGRLAQMRDLLRKVIAKLSSR